MSNVPAEQLHVEYVPDSKKRRPFVQTQRELNEEAGGALFQNSPARARRTNQTHVSIELCQSHLAVL